MRWRTANRCPGWRYGLASWARLDYPHWGNSHDAVLEATPRLPVADLARTIDFYIRTFGFHVASLWPKVAPTFVILENDNVEIQFYVPEGLAGEPSRHGTISFDVSDARAIHRSLEGHLTVEWGPEVYWYGRLEFAVCDPNGYMIILSEKTADPPTCLRG